MEVDVVLDDSPRRVEMPADLATALAGDSAAQDFYESLSTTNKKLFVNWIESAKKPETRRHRLSETVAKLRAGENRGEAARIAMTSGAAARHHTDITEAARPEESPVNRMVFVNLPVADVARARSFFHDLGFSFNEEYCDEKAACLVLNDMAFVMLLQREFFATFTPRPVADATAASEVLIAVSADSRGSVDLLVEAAVTAGGQEVRPPQEEGLMYQRSIADLDGHIWEVIWMAAPAGEPAASTSGVDGVATGADA